MLRSILRLSAAVALALLVSPLAPSAAPAPGVGYDEIVRVVIGATPPPPGNFQADLATVNSAAAAPAATPAPRKRGIGFGAIAGAVLGGGGAGSIAGAVASDAASDAMGNALQQSLGTQFAALGASIRSFLQPHVMHYAYYNGWERVDDVSAQTATIRKCATSGKSTGLTSPRKPTAFTIRTANRHPPQRRRSRSRARHARQRRPPLHRRHRREPQWPISVRARNRSARCESRIKPDDRLVHSTASFAMSQATGSCRNASASISTEQYLSAINRPTITSCPIRRQPVPESAGEAVTPPQTSGGCRPTFAFHNSGPPVPPGKLSLYTLVTMNAAAGATPAPSASGAAGVGFLTERGNVKTVTDAALFDVPADFTKTQ